jgi:formiminoglutamase
VSNVKVVIMGVPEYRGSAIELNGSFTALEKIRHYFYRLKRHDHKFSIADIGDIQPGERVEDTYHAVTETAEEFLNAGIIPVILGGTQDLTVPVFNAYKPLNRLINLVGIDARFDLGTPDNNLDQFSWLGKIIMQQPNFLFNFSNIGYQTYFVGSGSIQLMNNLFFDAYRLGEVRANISEMEPVIRNADHVSFDLSSIRQSDAPASLNPSPNGFSGEEACQA